MHAADNIVKVTVEQPSLDVQGMETSIVENTARVTVSQPALNVTGRFDMEITQEAVIFFGRWFKGEKGDSWENDFDIATNDDIDGLFEG